MNWKNDNDLLKRTFKTLFSGQIVYFIEEHRSIYLLIKWLDKITNGWLLQSARDGWLIRRILKLQIENATRNLNPQKKTVAFCLTTRAYRGNLGNIIKKMKEKGFYNVIIIYGEIIGDKFEGDTNALYLPNFIPSAWSCVDFADVCITSRPFHTSKPSGKIVYFLHDIQDSAIGNIEENYSTILSFDYFFLSSRFLMDRVRQQIMIAKSKYLADTKTFCIIGGGYPKLDNNLKYFEGHKQISKTLIFATTAINGPDMSGLIAFPSYADKIISVILDAFAEYEVIFRPHPLTTHEPEVCNVVKKFENCSKFVYDDNSSSYIHNYSKAAVMITDMSGTAYTYAFTTLRPVVFFSPNEQEVTRRFGDYQYFKDREKIGYVAETIGEMVEKIKLLLAEKDSFAPGIEEYRNSTIYNIGKSENYFVENIEYILEDKKHPDWIYV